MCKVIFTFSKNNFTFGLVEKIMKKPKRLKKTLLAKILGVLLGVISASLLTDKPLISWLRPYAEIIDTMSTILIPIALLGLFITIIATTFVAYFKNDINNVVLDFLSSFTLFFTINYIMKTLGSDHVFIFSGAVIVFISAGIGILYLINKIDELWRKVCNEAIGLGCYTTLGLSLMYGFLSPEIVELPDFQVEWCAYSLIFFSAIGFFIARYRYVYEK